MPVHKDPDGRRWVEAEALVPGDPETVWQAIATGPGISAWFVPSEMEERVGGAAVSHFAADGSMDSRGRISEWSPPSRFVVEADEGGPGPVATEWTVEALAGGTCRVRVTHSWFASSDDWDGQFEGHTFGWLAFFRILALYLGQFPGQACRAFQSMGMAGGTAPEAWAALTGALGVAGAEAGETIRTADDAPPLAGRVESAGVADYPELLVRLQTPAPGIAHLFPMAMGGRVLLTVRLFLYGPKAGEAVGPAEAAWNAWLAARFPAGG